MPRSDLMVSIGDLLLDISIVPEGRLRLDDDSPATITLGGGGQAANFCAWTASLHEPVRLVTRIGDDERGRELVKELESAGVEVRAVWAPEPTGAIAVTIGPDGQRTMATQRGPSTGLSPRDLDESWFRDARLIHVPAYSLFVEPLASATRAAISLVRDGGGLLALDLSSAAGLREFGASRMADTLSQLKPDVLFATESESEAIGVALESLAKVPVIKLGHAGCSVVGRTIPAPKVQVVDPTGAGDAFAAAFCVAWLHGATPIQAGERAVAVAAESTTRTGARPR